MRRRHALVVGVACLFACAPLAGATAVPGLDACATRPDLLGLSRIVEIDTDKGPLFGTTPRGEFDFLAEGEVVLTFDDGPSRRHTKAVLEALDAHCTKATFFMVGRMAVSDPAMVREVASRGHTVGVHTWSHAKLQGIDPDKAKDEIELGLSAVARAMRGPVAPFFRFPYLRTTPQSKRYLKSRHVASFGIDVDSRDFKTRSGAKVKATVLAQLAKRRKGILLFHDIQLSTAQGIKDILDALKARGYKVVHIVPKAAATTLADYDTLADRELLRRNAAKTKQPLATRSVVWSQQSGTDEQGREVLPWAKSPSPAKRATKAKAMSTSEGVPWYEQLWQPQ